MRAFVLGIRTWLSQWAEYMPSVQKQNKTKAIKQKLKKEMQDNLVDSSIIAVWPRVPVEVIYLSQFSVTA